MNPTAIVPVKGASAAATMGETAHAEPVKLRRRIGSTIYTLTIRFSESATETAEEKVRRIIEREVSLSA